MCRQYLILHLLCPTCRRVLHHQRATIGAKTTDADDLVAVLAQMRSKSLAVASNHPLPLTGMARKKWCRPVGDDDMTPLLSLERSSSRFVPAVAEYTSCGIDHRLLNPTSYWLTDMGLNGRTNKIRQAAGERSPAEYRERREFSWHQHVPGCRCWHWSGGRWLQRS